MILLLSAGGVCSLWETSKWRTIMIQFREFRVQSVSQYSVPCCIWQDNREGEAKRRKERDRSITSSVIICFHALELCRGSENKVTRSRAPKFNKVHRNENVHEPVDKKEAHGNKEVVLKCQTGLQNKWLEREKETACKSKWVEVR